MFTTVGAILSSVSDMLLEQGECLRHGVKRADEKEMCTTCILIYLFLTGETGKSRWLNR